MKSIAGDVDGDGNINIADVTSWIDILLGDNSNFNMVVSGAEEPYLWRIC